MSLTCILEIYLRFKGRKWCKLNHFRFCKLNHFRFWKIKKGLNEEISESRLMDYEERQNEDIISLGDHKWPLWSKKDGKQTWNMRHEINSSSCMKIWNSKSSGNMYSDFEAKFEALLKVHFRPTIYFLRLRKLEVQSFKQCANQRWNEEVMVIWRQLRKVEGPFRNDFEIQLMNSKSNLWIRNDPNFEFSLPVWCFASSTSGIAFRALHSPSYTTRNHHFISF